MIRGKVERHGIRAKYWREPCREPSRREPPCDEPLYKPSPPPSNSLPLTGSLSSPNYSPTPPLQPLPFPSAGRALGGGGAEAPAALVCLLVELVDLLLRGQGRHPFPLDNLTSLYEAFTCYLHPPQPFRKGDTESVSLTSLYRGKPGSGWVPYLKPLFVHGGRG